ncbi:Catenin alpha, partial [Araneus ventricosus]
LFRYPKIGVSRACQLVNLLLYYCRFKKLFIIYN